MGAWFEEFYSSLTLKQKRNYNRRNRVISFQFKISQKFFWMRWPILHMVYTFWSSVFEEGIRATLIPRWGSMTFAFLNDGIKPTVWHTLYTILHSPSAKFSGIYTDGAPKSRAEAEEWEAKWEKERREKSAAE